MTQRFTELQQQLGDDDAPPGFFEGKPASGKQRPGTKRKRSYQSNDPPLGEDASHEVIDVPAANIGFLIGTPSNALQCTVNPNPNPTVGTGGSMINGIRGKTKARIEFEPDEVNEDGTVSVFISSASAEVVKQARAEVRGHMAKVGIRGEDCGEYEDWLDQQINQRRQEAEDGTGEDYRLYELDGGERYPNTDKAFHSTAPTQELEPVGESEWLRGYDEATGRHYHWNSRTKASVWEAGTTSHQPSTHAAVANNNDGDEGDAAGPGSLGLLATYGSDSEE